MQRANGKLPLTTKNTNPNHQVGSRGNACGEAYSVWKCSRNFRGGDVGAQLNDLSQGKWRGLLAGTRRNRSQRGSSHCRESNGNGVRYVSEACVPSKTWDPFIGCCFLLASLQPLGRWSLVLGQSRRSMESLHRSSILTLATRQACGNDSQAIHSLATSKLGKHRDTRLAGQEPFALGIQKEQQLLWSPAPANCTPFEVP